MRQVVTRNGKFEKAFLGEHEASRRAEDGRRDSTGFKSKIEVVLSAERQDCNVFVGIQSIAFENEPGDVLESAAARGDGDEFSSQLLERLNFRVGNQIESRLGGDYGNQFDGNAARRCGQNRS